ITPSTSSVVIAQEANDDFVTDAESTNDPLHFRQVAHLFAGRPGPDSRPVPLTRLAPKTVLRPHRKAPAPRARDRIRAIGKYRRLPRLEHHIDPVRTSEEIGRRRALQVEMVALQGSISAFIPGFTEPPARRTFRQLQ